MTENSKLIPEKIMIQSHAAIAKLETDKEFLRKAQIAKHDFIYDDSLYSQGLNLAKEKLADYDTVNNTFVMAIDSAIADYRKLVFLVDGVPPLIGSDILYQIERSRSDRDFYAERVEYYRQVRDNTSWAQRNLAFWNSTYSRARTNQRRYEDCLETENQIIALCEQKIERYHEIEQASKEFFVVAKELVEKAVRGIGYIVQAATGLPYSFQSDGLTAWRTTVVVVKNHAIELESDGLIRFDADGNVSYDWERMREIMDRPFDEISDVEFRALVTALNHFESLEDINRFLGYLADEVNSFTVSDRGNPNYRLTESDITLLANLGFGDDLSTQRNDEVTLTAWEFCPRKVGMLQIFMDITMPLGENERSNAQQRQALLGSLQGLTSISAVPDQAIDGNTNIYSSNLIVSRQGERPHLELGIFPHERGDFISVNALTKSTRLFEHPLHLSGNTELRLGGRDPILQRSWHGFNSSSWQVTTSLEHGDAIAITNNQTRQFHGIEFAFEPTSFLSVLGNATDEGIGIGVGAIGGSVGGPVGMVAFNTARDLLNDIEARETSQRQLTTARTLTDTISTSNIANEVPMNIVLVVYDDGPISAHTHGIPGQTEPVLDAINASGQFEGKFTLGSIERDPEYVENWWLNLPSNYRKSIRDVSDEVSPNRGN